MANERSPVPILFPPPHSAAYGVTVLDAARYAGATPAASATLAAPLDLSHPLPEPLSEQDRRWQALHDNEPEWVKADRRRRMDNRNRMAEAGILRNGLPYWRNGAWLDMAELVNALADRGFAIDGYRPNVPLVGTLGPVQPFTNNTIPVDCVSTRAGITVELRVSHEKHQPYILTIVCTETAEALITGHTTTAPGALRTVDAFLAGLKFTGTRAC